MISTYIDAIVDPLGLHIFAVQVAVLLEVTINDLMRDASRALHSVVNDSFTTVAANNEFKGLARGLDES